MSEGQGKRRIGQGMKPRDKQAEDKHSHPLTHKDHTEPHEDCAECAPTAEGQPESIIEPILARQEGEQSDDHLEPETVQNLDSPETAGVAQSDPLEEALAESRKFYEPVIGPKEVALRNDPQYPELTEAEMDATAGKVADQFVRELTIEEMEAIAPMSSNWTPAPLRMELQGPGGGIIEIPSGIWQIDPAGQEWANIGAIRFESRLGLQPDGSYKIVTTIPEGYWQAVKDWAESDGATPEEWINRQLSGYLENWGSPAKGR
jgi:hypothetical protein